MLTGWFFGARNARALVAREPGCRQEPTAMSISSSLQNEGTDLPSRTVRALTECMSVLPEGGDVYTVVGQHGHTYSVDARDGKCTCPDHMHRRTSCKHIQRVDFATGRRPVPVHVRGIDDHLGEHADGTPRVAVTDGGEAHIAHPDSVEAEERPEDCGCWDVDQDLPCWPCYRDGFVTPNPAVPDEGARGA